MNSENGRTRAKLLIVDDRPENLFALEAVLQPLGHEVIRATSGAEALRQVLLHDFAVILLDVQMPEMNGFETAHFIKSREKSRYLPIIFLTAISKDEEYVFEGYSAGAVDYIFKPFKAEILRSKVAVFVDLYVKDIQLRRQNELLRESERRELELTHKTQLLESEAKYADILNTATAAIITLGADRRITLFNPAAEKTFLCTADEALGKPIDDFLHPRVDLAAVQTGRNGTRALEIMGIRATGDSFPVEFSLSSLILSGQRSYTLILRDISERRRAEDELQAQAISLANTTEELRALNEELHSRTVELERAMGARSRFYASMSHELRTPINAILGYSSLLMDRIYGPLNDQQHASVSRTHKAAHHLLELVNDILDLSKIEAGKMELNLEVLRFPEVIQDLFVTVRPFAELRETELFLEGPDEPISIHSDSRRVRQVLLNLVSNAIKFGGGKPVRVVYCRTKDRGVVIDVIDQGEGIALEDQDRIFEDFVQLSQDDRSQGTGLGLPISRRLAEILGGALTVSSTPGEGSSFRLTLPYSTPDLVTPTTSHEAVVGG